MEENDTLKTHLSAVDELRKENSSLKEKLFALECNYFKLMPSYFFLMWVLFVHGFFSTT